MSELPKIGKTVVVRGRPYLVKAISPQAFSDTPSKTQHFVQMSCLDENSLDEELNVIWEIEPGVEVKESASLPTMDSFDEPSHLRAFLNAIQWGIVSPKIDNTSLQASFRCGFRQEEYQLVPVLRALSMPRTSLLIADDVGLGKTIEAGLVIQELMLRKRVSTVLVVCPSSLQIQWKDEMRDKFGLEFRIIDRQSVADLRRKRGAHINPWGHFPRIITSMDYIKQDKMFRSFCELLPKKRTYPRRFDMLIVDEAHNVAPAGDFTENNALSLRTKVIRDISKHFEHKIFLSATPHNGYNESFYALLEMLDDQRFIRSVKPSDEDLSKVLVRRLKSEIKDGLGERMFAERKITPVEVNYTETEESLHSKLEEYAALCKSHLGGNPKINTALLAVLLVLKLLKKRLFSSPQAFAVSIEQHYKTRCSKVSYPSTKYTYSYDEDEDSDDESASCETMEESTAIMNTAFPDDERKLLEDIRKQALQNRERKDSKAEALLKELHKLLKKGDSWNNERVVIFTEYRETQKYIAELLATNGFGGERLESIHGGTPMEDRERIKAAFQADPEESPIRILIGTDAASEGINLQRYCSHVIHYEIPWNPSRLEQRNGRVDRHGQKAEIVDIRHFVAKGYKSDKQGEKGISLRADLEFLFRIVQKVENIRLDIGKVGPVIAKEVEDIMLGSGKTARVIDTSKVEREAESVRRIYKVDKEFEKARASIGSYIRETKNSLSLHPTTICETVKVALQLAGQPELRPAHIQDIPDGQAFFLPAFTGAWIACHEGNADPYKKTPRPIVFDETFVKDRSDVVLAHLNHRLVRMSLDFLRSQLWTPKESCCLHRASIRILPSTLEDIPVVLVSARLIVTGSTNQRILEELLTVGGRITNNGKSFVRMQVQELERFLSSVNANTETLIRVKRKEAAIKTIWDKIQKNIEKALEARLKERTETLNNRLARYMKAEEKRITNVMKDLGESIRNELRKFGEHISLDNSPQKPIPGSLLEMETPDTKNQADIAYLKDKLSEVPSMCKAEIEYLHSSYENPKTILLPLAVQWFLPSSMADSKGV